MDSAALRHALKRLIIEELDLRDHDAKDIDDDAPLFGDGLGLDSLDALQLAVAVEEKYSVQIPDDERAKPIFSSVSALADYVAKARPAS